MNNTCIRGHSKELYERSYTAKNGYTQRYCKVCNRESAKKSKHRSGKNKPLSVEPIEGFKDYNSGDKKIPKEGYCVRDHEMSVFGKTYTSKGKVISYCGECLRMSTRRHYHRHKRVKKDSSFKPLY